MKVKLTDALIASYKWQGKVEIYRDTEQDHLFLSVAKFKKSFKVQIDRTINGKRKTLRRTLGSASTMSVNQARDAAATMISLIESEVDFSPIELRSNTFANAAKSVMLCKNADMDCSYRGSKIRRIDKYFSAWDDQVLMNITRSDVVELLKHIETRESKSSAKICLRLLCELMHLDGGVELPKINIENLEYYSNDNNNGFSNTNIINGNKLYEWRIDLEKFVSPQRQIMHKLHLYSGLRPSLLAKIEKDWVRIDESKIEFPPSALAYANRLDLPLSNQLKNLCVSALEFPTLQTSDSKFLFPSAQRLGSPAILREPKMPGRTGHVLRNTYVATAKKCGAPEMFRRMCLDYSTTTIPVDRHLGWSKLLEFQSKISDRLDGYVWPPTTSQ